VLTTLLFLAAFSAIQVMLALHPGNSQTAEDDYASRLDRTLIRVLRDAGFTGNVEATLEARLGRRVDPGLADLGRLLFFDKMLGLHGDNSCSGCHSPAFGFGDSQPMAIGVDNNDIVGPNRRGPRNQRRSPLVSNTIFYPALMWTPRFVALSGDPFDPSLGFKFPPPENVVTGEPTLLAAQGSLPSTELVEMAVSPGLPPTQALLARAISSSTTGMARPYRRPMRPDSTTFPFKPPSTRDSIPFPRTSKSLE
jgi:cytochrome c peroxidase